MCPTFWEPLRNIKNECDMVCCLVGARNMQTNKWNIT